MQTLRGQVGLRLLPLLIYPSCFTSVHCKDRWRLPLLVVVCDAWNTSSLISRYGSPRVFHWLIKLERRRAESIQTDLGCFLSKERQTERVRVGKKSKSDAFVNHYTASATLCQPVLSTLCYQLSNVNLSPTIAKVIVRPCGQITVRRKIKRHFYGW